MCKAQLQEVREITYLTGNCRIRNLSKLLKSRSVRGTDWSPSNVTVGGRGLGSSRVVLGFPFLLRQINFIFFPRKLQIPANAVEGNVKRKRELVCLGFSSGCRVLGTGAGYLNVPRHAIFVYSWGQWCDLHSQNDENNSNNVSRTDVP